MVPLELGVLLTEPSIIVGGWLSRSTAAGASGHKSAEQDQQYCANHYVRFFSHAHTPVHGN
jgi:hypothetical protein